MNKAPVAGADPLAGIHQQYDQLRRSEKKVADFVVQQPSLCISLNINQLAQQAEVSEPTVMRFCKAIGCSGFQDFKLQLAKSIGNSQEPGFASLALHPDDDISIIKDKVFSATFQELILVRDSVNVDHLQTAASVLSSAERVEFFGFGASGIVASDAYHKFMRFQISTSACSDHHMQLISASTMKEGDVLVAISQSGRSKELIHSVKQAKKNQATVIGICPDQTPLAEYSDLPLSIAAEENTDLFTPLTSRLAHLVVIDVLATCVAMAKEPTLNQHLKSIKKGLRSVRLDDM